MCLSADTRRYTDFGHEEPLATFSSLPCADEDRNRRRTAHGCDPIEAHTRTAYDLFGTPQGSPRTDKLMVAGIQWVKKIMEQIDCDGE